MARPVAARLKPLVAAVVPTAEGSLPRVDAGVDVEVGFPAERLVADRATLMVAETATTDTALQL